ncbi:hypothetical protein [Botrimarina colliarenosi]|nr:hypothetical protein [Botrimarina colliarenosi]
MKRKIGVVGPFLSQAILAMGLLSTAPVCATSLVFNVLYTGNDVATLVPGSDDPDGASLAPGDDFLWTITADNSSYWLVEVSDDYFPLMAFAADPSAVRTGDFDLVLRNDGMEVFTLSETSVETQEVHVGTNGVTLTAGLAFDEMELHYTLTSSEDLTAGDPTDTVLTGLLPIFGAPEMNQFSPGIALVPEPATFWLTMTPLLCVRRRAERTRL